MIFYETKTAPQSELVQWYHTELEFGRSRVQIPVLTNLAVILSWLPSVIKANAGLHFHYHGPFDHYSSNLYIIKIKFANLTKKHNYTTIKNTQPSGSTPKEPKTRYDQRCYAFLNQRKNALIGAQKN